MLNKKIMVLTIVFVSLLAFGVVSASDNSTSNIVCADNDVSNECLQVADGTDSDELAAGIGTFADLAKDIGNSGSNLKLTKNYTYVYSDSDYKKGISIDKEVVIDGNGFTINGQNKAKPFIISQNNVVLKNINFINCLGDGDGAAIEWRGSNGILNNCTFLDSKCVSRVSDGRYLTSGADGGAIYWSGDKGIVNNCSFINCECISTSQCTWSLNWNYISASDASCYSRSYSRGGAICWYGNSGKVFNSSFVNSSTYSKVSALWSACNMEDYSLGGAIAWFGKDGSIGNCSFINTKSVTDVDLEFSEYSYGYGMISNKSNGNSIYLYMDNATVNNCVFINCSSLSNGTVCCEGNSGCILNSTFINCSGNYGGAIYWLGNDGSVVNCSFINCCCIYYGDSIYFMGNNGNVSNCTFISYQDYAQEIYVYWIGLYGSLENSNVDSLSKLYYSKYKLKLFNNKIGVNINIESPDNGIIILAIEDFKGKSLSNVKLSYVINGAYNKSGNTDSNGQIRLSGLSGKSIINVTFEGDESYRDCQKSATFSFTDSSNAEIIDDSTRIPIFIIAFPSSTTVGYNDKKEILIFVCDINGTAINGVKLNVIFSNGRTEAPITDKNGQVKLYTTGLAPKTYKATITFGGNSKYAKFTRTISIKVTKATPKLTAAKKTFKKSTKTKKYTITLKTNKNKVMKSTWVTLKVNKKTYKAKTNSRGKATFKITNLKKKGTFTAVVKYAGSKYYNAKTVKPKIIVK